MNERIRELAQQCKMIYQIPGGDTTACSPEIEKFAELIILECANITLDYKNHDHYTGWLDHGEEIARQFGVER